MIVSSTLSRGRAIIRKQNKTRAWPCKEKAIHHQHETCHQTQPCELPPPMAAKNTPSLKVARAFAMSDSTRQAPPKNRGAT